MRNPRTLSSPSVQRAQTRLASRSTQHVTVALATCLLALVLGCRDESDSPTGPDAPVAPALASAAAGTLSFRQSSVTSYPGTDAHTCGVTTDDRAYCWGAGMWGQLGDGEEAPDSCGSPCRTHPVAVAGGLRFRHVSTGSRYTCGVTLNYLAYCWGRNFEGQLGDGTTTHRPTPVLVAGGRRFRQIRTGVHHTCAITRADVAFCWGGNGVGELGDGTTSQRLAPTRVAGNLSWSQLSGGWLHSCGVTTTNRAYCWGLNQSGAVGDGTKNQRLAPVPVSGGLSFNQIDAGFDHTCAVTPAGRAYCWGLHALGNNTSGSSTTPVEVFGTRLYAHVSAGWGHTCGLARSDRGFCWGANGAGQLGDGTIAPRLKPTALAAPLTLTQVSATHGFSCAVAPTTRRTAGGPTATVSLATVRRAPVRSRCRLERQCSPGWHLQCRRS